jgi:hypothetical protein
MTENKNEYSIIVPSETITRARSYLIALQSDRVGAGRLLEQRREDSKSRWVSEMDLLGHLVETKKPQVFAESQVRGDGSDWNLTELGLLGDISVATEVTIFDNGNHSNPSVHEPPFRGTLVFTPGALLRNDCGLTPADWGEVTNPGGAFCFDGYYALYRRRLAPVLRWISSHANAGGGAVVTIPGLGCGQFAGAFRGSLGRQLSLVLRRLMEEVAAELSNIKVLYFDPYGECSNERCEIDGIQFLVRPLLAPGNEFKSQLSLPSSFAEEGDDFTACTLYSIVAWDHVSWPGNDFYGGARATDDGVKAAATDSMRAITGVDGHYDSRRFMYLPPAPYRTWADVVDRQKLRLWRQDSIWPDRVRL